MSLLDSPGHPCLSLAASRWSQDHQDGAPLEAWPLLDNAYVRELFRNVVHLPHGDFGMCDLPAPETNTYLQLGACFQERTALTDLEGNIMLPGLRSEPDLLDFDVFPCLARLSLTLGPFVLILAKVHQFDDRRLGVRGDLYQVQGALLCQTKSLRSRQDPKLLSVGVYHAELWRPNRGIDTCCSSANLSPPRFICGLARRPLSRAKAISHPVADDSTSDFQYSARGRVTPLHPLSCWRIIPQKRNWVKWQGTVSRSWMIQTRPEVAPA